jgi:hypothetical protein
VAWMESLSALGVALSLDDFGTGYSSLVRLRRLPVGEVKIDASFVRRLLRSADDEVIVRSIIDLVRALGIRSVSEGVETGETAAALRAMGCDAAQGWHFARPLPPRRPASGWPETVLHTPARGPRPRRFRGAPLFRARRRRRRVKRPPGGNCFLTSSRAPLGCLLLALAVASGRLRDASQGGGGAHSGAMGDDDNAARRPQADAQQAEGRQGAP